MTNREIKKESKIIIKGKRGNALSIILFNVTFCLGITAISYGAIRLSDSLFSFEALSSGRVITFIITGFALLVLSVFALCVYSSASVGEKAWYGGIASGKSNYRKRLFFWFKPAFSLRAFRFKFLLFGIKALLTLLFLLPSAAVLWSIYYLARTGGLEVYLFVSLAGGSALLALCGLIFRFIVVQRYFIAEYLFSSDPRLTPILALRQSCNLLDGHILEIVKFKLSFIPWYIACVTVLPLLYFLPYYKASCCTVAKKITV